MSVETENRDDEAMHETENLETSAALIHSPICTYKVRPGKLQSLENTTSRLCVSDPQTSQLRSIIAPQRL